MIKLLFLAIIAGAIGYGTALFQLGYDNHTDCKNLAKLDQVEGLWAPVGYRFFDNKWVSLPYSVCMEAKKVGDAISN